MFLLMRNIVFHLILLASMSFPVIRSCNTSSHDCSELINDRQIAVYLLQDGINQAAIDFDEPDTQASYIWTLRPFNRPDSHVIIDLNGPEYSSTSDVFTLQPTVSNQGLYYCRSTGGQQCPIDYCVKLISSPNITMFNVTYFEESNSTIFMSEITYNNNNNITTCLPIIRIIFSRTGMPNVNVATCFGDKFAECFPSTLQYNNSHNTVESGFKYNLTVSSSFAASDPFTLAVVGRTSVSSSSPTTTSIILSTTTFSTSATLTVISAATSTIEMTSTIPMMTSSSSLFESTLLSSLITDGSSSTMPLSTEPSMSSTPEPTETASPQTAAIIASAVLVSIIILIILVIAFLIILLRFYPRISSRRGSYKPTDGDDNTINTNGVTEPQFELSPEGSSKVAKV